METKWTAVERRRRYVGNSADMRHAGWTRLGPVNTAELQNMTAYLTSIVFTSGRPLARSEVLSGVGSWTKRFPFTWKRKKSGGQRERPTGEASRGRDARPAARVLKKRPTHRGRRSTARHGGVQKVCQSLENFMHGYFHAVMMPPVWRRAVGRASGRTASKQTRAASLDSKLAA